LLFAPKIAWGSSFSELFFRCCRSFPPRSLIHSAHAEQAETSRAGK
jgi:hypothetical protein